MVFLRFLLITYFLKLQLHHFSKIESHQEITKHSEQQEVGYSYYFCLIIEGSGSVPCNNGSGSATLHDTVLLLLPVDDHCVNCSVVGDEQRGVQREAVRPAAPALVNRRQRRGPAAGIRGARAHGGRVGNKKPTQKTHLKNPLKKPTKNVFY